ncbi:unnamed protein product [Fusarium venenatum]|uniref:Transcription factor domain-containing protein n=1 Tax=Fusarium venenatum TaxID=56646 RepID=A0A2L2TAL2_9HYPO|nr:uncharacterized protein FVRRES_05803 [Fusarium venenatum]CEI61367.1 unnamed protein product [Fusarium venenatum]
MERGLRQTNESFTESVSLQVQKRLSTVQSEKGEPSLHSQRYAVTKFARSNATKRSQLAVAAKREIFTALDMLLMFDEPVQTVPQQPLPDDPSLLARTTETSIRDDESEPWLNMPSQWDSMPSVTPPHVEATDAAVVLLEPESMESPDATWECPDLDGMAWSDIQDTLPLPFSVIEQLSGPRVLQTEDISATQLLPPTSENPFQITTLPQRPMMDQVQVPRQILHVPTALSEYFFSEVIPLYCVWDSKLNIMRNITETMWQSSGALHHTIQSMAAACLSENFPHLLPVARQEHSRALVFIKDKTTVTAQKQAMALAATFLGHTSSWISPDNLAPDMYQTSWDILDEMTTDNGSSATSFFDNTMDYWAMLLAYLTDTQHLRISKKYSPLAATRQEKLVEPHPYCGISNGVIKILRDIGIIIFTYRNQMSKASFMTEEHVDVFRHSLREARRLERVLLAHRPPDMSQIKDPGDPQTPLKHLELMDEAYRFTGLLQLYRVFPDLLIERYAPWDQEKILQPLPGTKAPTIEERQTWLTELALHVITILETIPFESHTRSAQPFIMVAVSSELVLSSKQTSSGDDFETLDHLPFRVTRARKFLASRLAAYTHILPLQKTRAISQLINHIWAALDAGEQQVYWLDVAYEKKMGTMFG